MAKSKKRRSRKKRYKKAYDIKVLRARWKLQRFDPKRRDAIMKTIISIIWAVFFTIVSVFGVFVHGIYKPIDRSNAESYTVEFDYFDIYHRHRSHSQESLVLTNGEKIWLPHVYFVGDENLYYELHEIESQIPLIIKQHPNGTVLEISYGLGEQQEILNFDYAQKKQFQLSLLLFTVGILCGLGAIALFIYAGIMTIKRKVFAPSKNIYRR